MTGSFISPFKMRQVIIKPIISRGYELFIKSLLFDPCLVACCEQNRLSFSIEGECHRQFDDLRARFKILIINLVSHFLWTYQINASWQF